jgi:hypothetical protein
MTRRPAKQLKQMRRPPIRAQRPRLVQPAPRKVPPHYRSR